MTAPLPPIDPDLILRYDRPGPRYTSYPPAPQFRELDLDTYRAVIEERSSRCAEAPIALYVHIPFCKSVCYFCGCNVYYTKNRSLAEPYVARLLRETRALGDLLDPRVRLVELQWGGGTPTFLSAELLERLACGIFERFAPTEEADLGVEIDPREVDEEKLAALARVGFRRVSIGVQDFDPQVQEAVHRRQPFELTRDVIEACRDLGFESVNVDLIYGLPHQSPRSIGRTIDRVLELAPDRLAVFNFAYLPDAIPHQRGIDSDALPAARTKLEILAQIISTLTRAGYVHIGMDHFARETDDLARALENGTLHRSFQGYTTRAGSDLFGIGATSIGEIGAAYVQNQKDPRVWAEAVDRDGLAPFRGLRLSADDVLRRDVIRRLLCRFALVKAEIEREHGIEFDDTFSDAIELLRPMADDGLVEIRSDRIDVLPLGRLLVRNVAMAFDAYRGSGGPRSYSRTV